MTPEHEIWLPVSVEKKHGYVFVNPARALYKSSNSGYRLTLESQTNLKYQGSPSPYHFHRFNGSVRYVNGRNVVYQTNIVHPEMISFFPEGREWMDETLSFETILFRKLHKLEWLFA